MFSVAVKLHCYFELLKLITLLEILNTFSGISLAALTFFGNRYEKLWDLHCTGSSLLFIVTVMIV